MSVERDRQLLQHAKFWLERGFVTPFPEIRLILQRFVELLETKQ